MTFCFNEELVFPNLNCKTKEETLEFLSGKLYESQYVSADFQSAILEREKTYPTGLPSEGVGIAIPHTDNKYVYKTTMAIGILNEPVLFQSMDNKNKEIKIQIILMLAIEEPHGQLEALQQVVSLIQNKKLVQKLTETTTKSEIIKLIKPYFNQVTQK